MSWGDKILFPNQESSSRPSRLSVDFSLAIDIKNEITNIQARVIAADMVFSCVDYLVTLHTSPVKALNHHSGIELSFDDLYRALTVLRRCSDPDIET
jgi:hypothetical protein